MYLSEAALSGILLAAVLAPLLLAVAYYESMRSKSRKEEKEKIDAAFNQGLEFTNSQSKLYKQECEELQVKYIERTLGVGKQKATEIQKLIAESTQWIDFYNADTKKDQLSIIEIAQSENESK